VSSLGVELYPLLLIPQRRSPSSITAAQWLDLAVESQDPGARPLPDGAAKRANHHSTRLPHRLNRSCGVPEPDGLASREGSAGGGGGGAARVGEVGGVVSVCGASVPWGRPRGPIEMCVVR
jgi:hypothetical protein